jgi:hypothetical protein
MDRQQLSGKCIELRQSAKLFPGGLRFIRNRRPGGLPAGLAGEIFGNVRVKGEGKRAPEFRCAASGRWS